VTSGDLSTRASAYFEALQREICDALAALDGQAVFRRDRWQRDGGGGGLSMVAADGAVFEKAGVNTSAVWGQLDDRALQALGGSDRSFFATGISLVLHPRSPMVPAIHANLRYLERGSSAWFGGGSDLTPIYPYAEDARDFHRAWKATCDRHDPAYYPRFKAWCDEYFYLPHRREMRGVGGIFFDELGGELESHFAYVRDCGSTIVDAYRPIVERRRAEPYAERERAFQLYRRGRYVEFNLIYDRGTSFGLATGGRTESILMSLPPLARWEYDWRPQPDSREERALQYFQPRDWIGDAT